MMLALWMAWIFLRWCLRAYVKGETRDAGRGLFGDDLQALDYARHDLVLEAGVKALRVFANDDEVDAGIPGRNMGQVLDRTEVGVELELLAQGNVDTGEAAADRRGHWPFQSDPRAFDGVDQFLGNVFVVLWQTPRRRPEKFPTQTSPRWLRECAPSRCVTSGPMPSPGIRVIL